MLLPDGEHDEGNTWEAILAGKEKLNNIIAIVDRNNIQIGGYTGRYFTTWRFNCQV